MFQLIASFQIYSNKAFLSFHITLNWSLWYFQGQHMHAYMRRNHFATPTHRYFYNATISALKVRGLNIVAYVVKYVAADPLIQLSSIILISILKKTTWFKRGKMIPYFLFVHILDKKNIHNKIQSNSSKSRVLNLIMNQKYSTWMLMTCYRTFNCWNLP